MEMDHHCYWIGNCVGIGNKKFFFQYGLYVFLMDIFIIFEYIYIMVKTWKTFNFYNDWRIVCGLVIAIFTF